MPDHVAEFHEAERTGPFPGVAWRAMEPADGARTVARLLVECLENERVAYVLGLPGEENLHLIDALASSSIRFVTARDERGAAFMRRCR